MRHPFASLHAMAGTPERNIRRCRGITQATLDRPYCALATTDHDVDAMELKNAFPPPSLPHGLPCK